MMSTVGLYESVSNEGTTIQTKNMTSLIHKSDGNVRESCKVEIHFQWIKDEDEEKYTVMPESSFRLSRVVQRDGRNQYTINDEPATHKEVHELLLRAGIDLTHNRFMILQGEVEAIALMKPTAKDLDEGMLEYVEDEKYAPVISNIYNFLDYHIVETNDDSQFGIEMLHENKIGRTSFNALCNMRVNQTAMNRKPYEFPAERLFDKITTTVPGIRECYYYYLKDLLVVNNLTEAQKLFQKHDGKYLVCSLDTSIITSSGAVTGGGRPGPARIRVNNRVPRQDKSGEIVRLSGVIENLTKRHNEIKDQIAREMAEKDSCSLTELLLRAGIDLTHNRLMILQGEVEAIALMKPTAKDLDEGMLEYVEDLIGTNRFKVPIAKITHRISRLEVKLTRAKAFARRIEATINELVEPMRECVEYIDMKKALLVVHTRKEDGNIRSCTRRPRTSRASPRRPPARLYTRHATPSSS